MVSLPHYVEASASEDFDAWLERDGKRVPLRRVVEDELDPLRALPAASKDGAAAARLDARTLETIAAVASAMDAVGRVAPALAAMPKLPSMPRSPRLPQAFGEVATIDKAVVADKAVAEIERFGAPAFVSPYRLTPAEAASLFRDAPPRRSPAELAAFAAAERHFPKG